MKVRATFYGIPCYYEEIDNRLEGRNVFYDYLLNIAIIFHCGCSFISEILFGIGLDFPIYFQEEEK
jgi:hypothetical protein